MTVSMKQHVGDVEMESHETEDEKNLLQLKKLMKEMHEKSSLLCEKASALKNSLSEKSTKDGLSWLELKNHLLLSYMIESKHVVNRKLKGKKIEGHTSIDRLVEYRTVLERMRPVDQKLKYQIQKLVKVARSGKVDKKDPLGYRANLDAFEEDDGKDNEKSDEKNEKETKNRQGSSVKQGVYVAPRLAPVHYTEDETDEARTERLQSKAKKRALSSNIISELRAEYYDGPQEVREEYNPHKEKLNQQRREREKFEEENFVRLQVSKQEKHANRLQGFAVLDDITKFGGSSTDGMPSGKSGKKRKMSGGKGKKKRMKGKGGFKRK